MEVTIVAGDLLVQNVDAIINSWNRNLFPWWLLLPQGVSGAIKKHAGIKPFNELIKYGLLPLGAAVETSAGKLNYKAIIHVAGINLFWRASEKSIRLSVQNALHIAGKRGYESIAFPVIGAGSGGFNLNKSIEIMRDEISKYSYGFTVIIVVKR